MLCPSKIESPEPFGKKVGHYGFNRDITRRAEEVVQIARDPVLVLNLIIAIDRGMGGFRQWDCFIREVYRVGASLSASRPKKTGSEQE